MSKLKNIHPGEILLEEFLIPLKLSQNQLARDIDTPPRRINEIVHGIRAITADTDLRLSKALGTSEGFWLGLQADYDLEEQISKTPIQTTDPSTQIAPLKTRDPIIANVQKQYCVSKTMHKADDRHCFVLQRT